MDTKALIDGFYEHLKKLTTFQSGLYGWQDVSLPFLTFHNDTIDIYVRKNGNKYYFSDDGLICQRLREQRYRHLRKTAEHITINYGIKIKDDELRASATQDDYAEKLLNMLEVIIRLTTLIEYAGV